MADRIIVVSPDELIRVSSVHPEMIKDLLAVSSIPIENIDQLATTLESEDGILDEKQLEQIVATCIDDEDLASAAANAIQNLRQGNIDQVIEMIGDWRVSDTTNTERFPDTAFENLKEKLPRLIKNHAVISRMRKAIRLRGILGNELESIDFICDARPVFDQDRERIEGLLPLTTIKLVYERQNGTSEELEIIVTSEQLEEIITKAKKAQKKLRILESSIAQWVNG